VAFLSGLAAGCVPNAARAATATATMNITATVTATCLVSASNMAFAIYTGVVDTSTATVTLTCTNTTPYNIELNAGVSTGATVTTRKMTLTTTTLAYVLTQDAAYAVNWGQTVGTDTVAGTGNGAAQPVTVYGRVAAGQYVTPGAYTDTVMVTIAY
jgi:spore coat protein U-like protein